MKKLIKIRRLKRPYSLCDLHGHDCPKAPIHMEIETVFKYVGFCLCDAGLAELVTALNEAAEKVKQ